MKRLLAPAFALMVVSAGSALAADLPVRKAPVIAPPVVRTTWTGCYVGAGGGYGMWNQENQTVDALGVPYDLITTNGGRGWFGTVQVGCDYQFGPNWVIGAFGDWDFSSIKGHMSSPEYGVIGEEKLRNSWAAGGRIGFVVLPQLLTYLSGGYTEARFSSVSFYDAFTAGPTTFSVDARTYSGWFIGSGYEYGLSFLPGLFWKTEYRFSSYDRERNEILDAGVLTTDAIESRKYVQTIRSALVWRWNWGRW